MLGPFLVGAIRPKHSEKLKQKYVATLALAKAISRTISLPLGYAAFPLEWIPNNPRIAPKRGGAAKRHKTVVGQRPYEEQETSTFRRTNRLGTRARFAFEIALGTALRREDLCNIPLGDNELKHHDDRRQERRTRGSSGD